MKEIHNLKARAIARATRLLRDCADRLEISGAASAKQRNVPLGLYKFFERLRGTNQIQTVLDVGANRGEFAAYCAECLPEAKIYAFEPLTAVQAELQLIARRYPQVSIRQVAVGAMSGCLEMFENEYVQSSSFLPMLSLHQELWPHTAKTHAVKVPVETLDSLVEKDAPKPPYFVKIDVQGYEMEVLRGAEKTLRDATTVMMEVLFEPLYDGQSDFRSLSEFMNARGFKFIEFQEECRQRPDAGLIFADAVFVKRPS